MIDNTYFILYDEINNVIITKKMNFFEIADLLFHNATNLKPIGTIPNVFNAG